MALIRLILNGFWHSNSQIDTVFFLENMMVSLDSLTDT